jgi:hypothetical protein
MQHEHHPRKPAPPANRRFDMTHNPSNVVYLAASPAVLQPRNVLVDSARTVYKGSSMSTTDPDAAALLNVLHSIYYFIQIELRRDAVRDAAIAMVPYMSKKFVPPPRLHLVHCATTAKGT